MKNTDKNATKAKRSLMARLAELFGFRRERSLPRSENGSRHRAAESGNVFFTLFGAVAVVGVLGAGIMSTMRGPLTTMVEVNRIEETKAQSRMNARLILLDAASKMDGTNDYCGVGDDIAASGVVEYTEAVPYAAGAGPTGGGVIPAGVDGAKNDPWGQAYGYCVWNNGADTTCANTLPGQENLNAPAIAIVSGGPDRTITTTCTQAGALDIQGDDIVETLTYSEAVSASGGLWTDSGSTIDSGKALNVTDAVNDSSFGAGATFGGNLTTTGNLNLQTPGAIANVDVIQAVGAGTVVSINDNLDTQGTIFNSTGNLTLDDNVIVTGTSDLQGSVANSTGNLTLGDDVDVSGALDVVGALDVSGSITDTSDNVVTVDDALSVTGAADITGNFAVNTNMFTVDAATGNTVVAGTTELNGKTIIRGDGTDATTNAFEIWNAAATPLELMRVDDAGNMAIAGRLLTGGFDETVSIYGTTTDGSTDPLVIYDGAGTPVEVFSVDTDGHISIDGAADGNMLIATGTEFSPVAMSGDATISSTGVIDLEAGAVDNDEIADGAVDTDELADGAVTGAKIGLGVAGGGTYDCLKLDGSNIVTQACGSGGGGDGVGLDGFVDLADTPGAYAGAAADADKLVVVNPTGDGLIFADAATIVPPADRLEDRVDTANAKPVDTYIDVDTTDNGATNSIVFVTDGTQRMVITETGQVAIPREQSFGTLHLGSFTPLVGVDSANALVFGSLTSNTRSRVKIGGVSGAIDLMTNSQNIIFSNGALNAENMRLNPSGALGLGTGATIDNSAILQLQSTTRGFLAPRLTNAQATTLAAVPPATGLLIFNTEAGNNGIFQFWDGSAWVDVGGGGAATGGLWEPDGSNDYIEYDDTLGGVRIGRVTGQPAPATDWLLDVTNSVVYTTANKVGINSTTISPGLNVDITGNIGATNYCDQDGGDCFSAGDIATLAGGGGVDSDRIEDGGDANTYIDADPADDDSTNSIVFFNAGSQSMVVDADGELGIGITDPQSTLHLNTTAPGLGTDMSALNKATAAIRITEGGNELFMDSNTIMNEGSNLLYGVVGAHDLIYYTTAVERMRILSTGAVGINNNSPQTQLDVTGTLRIGDGSELCNVAGHEGALRYVAASDTYQVCANSATGWEDLFATGTGAAGLWTDVGGNRIHYGATGFERVGIATTSPITTLDVNGGVRVGSVSGNAPTYLSLNSLSNVDASAPANNQVLTYNSGSGNWEPYSSSSIVSSILLNDLANVSAASPTDEQCLLYNSGSGNWEAGDCDPSGNTSEWTDDGSGNIYNTDGGNVGIGTGGSPNQYSMLDITSTDSGVLLPRMTTAQRDAMDDAYAASENGMMIYNTTNSLFEYWDGDSWASFSASAGSTSLLQDADPDTSINVDTAGDGTANSIVFTNNSAETMRITATGEIGMGTSTPANDLEVVGDIRSDTIILNGTAGDAPTYTTPNLALNDLNNVSAASPTTNDVLTWNGTAWVNSAGGGGGGSIDALSDAAHDSTTDFNLFMGVDAGASITTGGQYNIALGQTAADALTTGDSNVAMGHNALGAAVDNQGSVAIGRNAASLSNNTHRLVAIGNNAAQNYNGASWHSIVAIGADAFTNVTAGAGITAIGNEAMNNFPGDYNTAIGNLTMFASNGGGGNDNIGMGHHTGSYMSGNRNVVIGTEAFKGGFSGDYDHRGNDNVFLGDQSAMNATGNNNDNNIFIGSNTGASLRNGANNILIGYNVDVSSGTAANELNIGNTLYGNLSTDDIGIGTATPSDDLHIYDSTNRGKITIEGADAQQSVIELLTDGDGATNLDDGGAARGWSLYSYNNTWGTTVQRNDFGISYYNGGWQDYLYMDSQNYYVGIFNTAPNVALDVTGDIEYTGTLADVSDIRLKKDIKPLDTDEMIQRIMNVDTYTFVMKDDEAGQVEYGVMAQEIEKIFPELVRTANDEMGTKSVNYVGLIAPMIEATKSLKAENEALKAEIADIKTAQADILEEVKGIARHTGYGMEKGDMMYLFTAMMIMMLSGFGLAHMYRRKGSGNKE